MCPLYICVFYFLLLPTLYVSVILLDPEVRCWIRGQRVFVYHLLTLTHSKHTVCVDVSAEGMNKNCSLLYIDLGNK